MAFGDNIRRGRADGAKQTAGKKPNEVTGKNIRDALEHMCQYLAERQVNIDLIAIESTFDALWYTNYTDTAPGPPRSAFEVDFFHLDHNAATQKHLKEAIAHARKITGVNLQGDWLQHEHSCLSGTDAKTRMLDLISQSKDQNQEMLHRRGLTVYAAPWHFLFINKVVKLCRRGMWASKIQYMDAAFFLRQYIYLKANKTGQVREIDIDNWLDRYSLSAQRGRVELANVLADIAWIYKEEYSEDGAVEQALLDKAYSNGWNPKSFDI